MRKNLYAKLAKDNIKLNGKTYLPYILTCIGCAMMFYIICALSMNSHLKDSFGGGTAQFFLQLGTVVVGFFSLIFLFYTNSFLIKRRKKEFGLMNILGMEKRHLSRVMLYETLYVMVLSLVIGILGGLLLGKLVFLLVQKMMAFPSILEYEIIPKAIFITIGLFAAIFFLSLLNNLRQIHLANPAELLRGSNVGEKEPRGSILLTLLGIFTLAGGYGISILTTDPLAALMMFFVAVFLVIIGTYCLFTSGSIALLKLLRKNKNYYYKTNHFISISGMMYRMKQNAVGLANICILSTCVLVMISSTVCLYLGVDDTIKNMYPYDITLTPLLENSQDSTTSEVTAATDDAIFQVLKEENVVPTKLHQYGYLRLFCAAQGNDLLLRTNDFSGKATIYHFLTLEDYNAIHGTNVTLAENQVLFLGQPESFSENIMNLGGNTYQIKEHLNQWDGVKYSEFYSTNIVVLPSKQALLSLEQTYRDGTDDDELLYQYQYEINTGLDQDANLALYEKLSDRIAPISEQWDTTFRIVSRAQNTIEVYSMFGGLFFLGIFLGILFIMATILIIYYKQISEGYEDKERYAIMQKVGLSLREVKGAISSQVLTVFFLPLIAAGVHIAFAFPVISRLLKVLQMTNLNLFILCTIGTFLVFAICYGVIYAITARTYYKIVR